MDRIEASELNELCKQVEIAYRNRSGRWNVRLRIIKAAHVRDTILAGRIGMLCSVCLKPRTSARYCCAEHRAYYQAITNHFYFPQKPIKERGRRNRRNSTMARRGKTCPSCMKEIDELSIDHIVPITRGGLEFDRENLQWMCLRCNIKKGNKATEVRTKSIAVLQHQRLADRRSRRPRPARVD
jgi:5-methylcytosine-specific restriction endonuclease McrA